MTLLRALAATALVLGAAGVVAPAPASAATCVDGGGVSVVVDYRELGGTTVTACAPDGGGKSAAAIFAEAGVQISYAQRQPGFVCRVNGAPASDPCVSTSPPDAFWGLWWSDGTRPWTYSSSGVGSLTVPAGGSVGWAWQQDRPAGGAVPPGVAAPPAPAPSSSPSATSTTSSSPTPTSTPTSTASPTRSPEPTSSPTRIPREDGTKADAGPRDRADGAKEAGSDEAGAAPDVGPSASSTSAPGTVEDPDAKDSDKQEKGRDGDAPEAATTAAEPTAGAATPGTDAATEPTDSAGADSADEPTRVPAVVTWGVVALLGVAGVVGGVVSRRRRRGA